jgi:hypothetical protein
MHVLGVASVGHGVVTPVGRSWPGLGIDPPV